MVNFFLILVSVVLSCKLKSSQAHGHVSTPLSLLLMSYTHGMVFWRENKQYLLLYPHISIVFPCHQYYSSLISSYTPLLSFIICHLLNMYPIYLLLSTIIRYSWYSHHHHLLCTAAPYPGPLLDYELVTT